MIKQPQQMTFTDKKFSMIVYGSPGIGKTTLALSAPDPILIDFENGVDRVRADHRKLTIVCENYEEVLHDIESPEVRDCQSIIIDTGGSFINYLKDWAMRVKGCRAKDGSFNSLKGYGVVKNEFASFTSRLRDAMHKNVIYIFHADEKADKDGNPQQRLLCEGATKNSVWNSCDFGGYMQMLGESRTIAPTGSPGSCRCRTRGSTTRTTSCRTSLTRRRPTSPTKTTSSPRCRRSTKPS